MVKDVHALNGNLAAIAINCTATEIEVTFNSSAAATDFAALLNPNSTFLPILEEWGCTYPKWPVDTQQTLRPRACCPRKCPAPPGVAGHPLPSVFIDIADDSHPPFPPPPARAP